MTRIWTLVLTVVALMSVAAPAAADPVTGWLAVNVFGWAGATMGAFLASAAVSLGTGLLGAALTGAAAQQGQSYDVKFDVEFGDDTPLTFTVGDFATAGKRRFIAKWGRETRFITEVIEVSSLPQGFAGAWVNDERAALIAGKVGTVVTGIPLFGPSSIRSLPAHDIGAVPATHTIVGWPLSNMKDDEGEGDLGARIWVKWIDGTQTAADPFLLWAFGEDADYPWTANHIGTGKTYVIVTTRFDSETLTSYPTFLWEPEPLPLYDPRYDSTAGGQGAQRWGDRATYQPSRNAAVISYNIARGIYWGDEWLFGGKNMAQWRLPLAEWMAAMNACDMPVSLAEGGTEPAYRAGLQITVSDEPLGVMEEIGKGANMRYAEVGGMLKAVVGLPAAPVFAITDADIVISEGQSLTPFAPASQTFNTITATFPDPTAKWASRDAPEYISEAGVAADGGRHLPTSLSYPAVPYLHQVQRLMRAQLEDYRRDVIVEFCLPPDAYALEPLVDTISWTSARNGYDAKQFVVEQVTKLPGMNVTVRLREVDPADYDWSPSFELPYDSVAPVPEIPWVQAIDGWTAVASIERDANGSGRVAAILVGCDGDSVAIAQVRIQVRRAGEAQPTVDALRPYDAPYRWKILGVAPSTTYEVRGALQSELTGRYDWSDWITVTTPDITVTAVQLSGEIRDSLDELNAWIDGDVINTLTDNLLVLSDQVGPLYAEGKFRVTAQATPGGAVSRIALMAVAGSHEGAGRTAAFFLQATSDGGSLAIVDAHRFAITGGSTDVFPFIVDGGTVYIDKARIRDADIDTLKIAGNAVTVPAYAYWEPSSPTFVTNSADYTLLELTVDRRGLATMITANAQLDGSSQSMRIAVWLMRNGQQIGASYGYGDAMRQSAVINFIDWDTGEGPTTYALMARTVVHASNVYQRFLSAHQFRR
ncbi:phage tail protein [Ketogulonicigenium vulgare]|uniref:phage tail protein n=1 Tax=Ketogulonicigenium vulgare TaxID=92945 RepID=UPI002359A058|nr:phage tail protein [Ketogulonicigenium vulgare]